MLAAALLILLASSPDAGAAPLVLGDPAPALALPDLDGRTHPDALQGRITLVEFSATWCGPCEASRRDLIDLERRFAGRVRVILIDVREPAAQVRRFYATRPLPAGARLLLDPDATTAHRWGAIRYPTTFFVDAQGVVRHINRGHGPGFVARATRWLDRMLAPR